MHKKKKTADVAGELNETFQVRLPQVVRDNFVASLKVGGGGKVSGADAVRSFIEVRTAFVKVHARQPSSLVELFAWYLSLNAPALLADEGKTAPALKIVMQGERAAEDDSSYKVTRKVPPPKGQPRARSTKAVRDMARREGKKPTPPSGK